MFKQFFKDSVVYGIGTVLSQGIGLILLPLYTRVFSPANYGIIDILIIVAKLVNLTVALEISQGLARHYQDAKTGEDRVRYASTALWFTVTMYSLFVLIGIWLAVPLSEMLLETKEQHTILQIALLSMWAEGLFLVVQNQLRFRLQPTLYAITSILSITVSVLIIVTLLLGIGLGVVGVFYGQFIGVLVGAGLGLFFARQDYRLVFDWSKGKEMLSFSIPLVPSSIAVFFALYIDRIAVKTLMSMADLGLIGVGYRVASIAMLLMVGFQSALIPLIYAHYQEANTPAELARIFRYFIILALFVFIGLSIFASEILTILTTPGYYTAAIVLPILVPAILLYRMYIFAPGLAIAKQTGKIAIINITVALLNTILNFVLVPQLGITGAALATLLSAVVAFCTYMVYSQKLYYVPHSWRLYVFAMLVAVGIVLIGAQVEAGFWGNIIVKSSLLLVTAIGFILMGLAKLDELQYARLWLSRLQFGNKL